MPFSTDYQAALNALQIAQLQTSDETIVDALTTNATALGTLSGAVSDTSDSMVLATGTTQPRALEDRFAEELCVLDFFPGTYTSGTDISDALIAALATNKNVYMPGGYTYRIKKQITIGAQIRAQRLRGDGKSTCILVEASFDPAATSIFLLKGAEQCGPVIQDLWLLCAQPINATSRADFVTLGTPGAGLGLLGIKYPPAILFANGCNRFRIERIRISNCWDGIHQAADGTASGGWWIRDIEISPFNIGLKVEYTLDFCHVSGWHHWYFDQTVPNRNIMRDGLSFCMMFGEGGLKAEGVNVEEVNNFTGRIKINTYGSHVTFANVFMDGDNATFDIVDVMWCQISNIYFSCSSAGPSSDEPHIRMAGIGRLHITNVTGWTGSQPWIRQTNGILLINGGYMLSSVTDVPFVVQSGGYCRLTNLDLRMVQNTEWVNAAFQCTNGTFSLRDSIVTTPAVGSNPQLVSITTDGAGHSVSGVVMNGWKFTPPGTLGDYQSGGEFYTKGIHAGAATFGSATALGTNMTMHATGQKTINIYNNNSIRWALGGTGGGGGYTLDDFAILRYNDAGALQANTFSINRTTGILNLSYAGNVITWAINPTDMPAQSGWRALGIQGTTSITPTIDVICTSDNSANQMLFRRSRGIPTALTAIANNDQIGNISFWGYDGGAWVSNGALIRAYASAAWSAGVHDTNLQFFATVGTTVASPLTLTGTAAVFSLPITSGTASTYGNQIKLGITNQAGRVDFARGTDGGFASWVGIDAAVGANLAMVTTNGTPIVYLDARNSGGTVSLRTNAVERFAVTDTAVTVIQPLTINASGPTIRAGTGAATGTQPAGSIWLRTDGTAGNRLYVSAGAGTWTPVATV